MKTEKPNSDTEYTDGRLYTMIMTPPECLENHESSCNECWVESGLFPAVLDHNGIPKYLSPEDRGEKKFIKGKLISAKSQKNTLP